MMSVENERITVCVEKKAFDNFLLGGLHFEGTMEVYKKISFANVPFLWKRPSCEETKFQRFWQRSCFSATSMLTRIRE